MSQTIRIQINSHFASHGWSFIYIMWPLWSTIWSLGQARWQGRESSRRLQHPWLLPSPCHFYSAHCQKTHTCCVSFFVTKPSLGYCLIIVDVGFISQQSQGKGEWFIPRVRFIVHSNILYLYIGIISHRTGRRVIKYEIYHLWKVAKYQPNI